MTMNPQSFDYICKVLKERSGISLTPDKQYLVETRLVPVVRELGLDSIDQLSEMLQRGRDPSVMDKLIEAMTTNETSFFRDLKPFQQFEQVVIPHVVENAKGLQHFDIWCAASSSGQEPYSIAMTLMEKRTQLGACTPHITATDIDKSILKRARDGIYTQFEVQRGLPVTHLMKYFRQLKEQGDKWVIKDEVKALIKFEQFNLLDDPGRLGKFDVIFCRNVLIYFEPPTKAAILNRLTDRLKPHGLLFLGSSETVMGLSDRLTTFKDQRGVYCLK